LAVFAQGTYIDRNHDEPTIESPLNRDSENFEVEAGVDFELASLIRGDIAVGYLRTEFDDPALSAITGVSADAIFEWFVTQLTTVTLNATRQVDASGLVETAGRTTTVLGAQVDHELLRNVLLNARVEYTDFDFQDIDRQDDRIQLGAGALYKLNRRVQFTADYRYRDENSSGTDADIDFTEHLVMIGVRLFP
ncbi:MAG: outer membrane beta-barrel protein, partial [Pseudomonadota bacterium]